MRSPTITPPPRLLAVAAAWLIIAVVTVVAVLSVMPPSPRTDVPADEPSAAAAFAHVERIGARTHVAGSAANDEVRTYILDTLRGFGVQTRVQDTVGVNGEQAARVRNVVATIPGTAPEAERGRVFLVAHYDSVQVGPGANDDGAGVSTLLESARVLRAAPLRNDVVLLFTDAEEACLCGAQAFVASDPLAAQGGVVLNVEARGTGGPVIMFETTRGNANLIDVYAAAAPHPVATSFAVEVYRILPNDTDFSPFRDAGRFTGLNSAYIDGAAAYHSPEDVPARMDRGSLQAHLDSAVALARAFGDQDVTAMPAAQDATYFPVLDMLVHYPESAVWPLAVLAAVTVLALAVVARWRRAASVPRMLGGLLAAVVPLVGAPLLAQGGWWLLVVIRPDYAGVRDVWNPTWYRWALVVLVAAVVLTWFALLRKVIGAVALGVGGLAWLAALGIVLASLAPGGSYLAAVPALVGAVCALVAVAVGRTGVGVAAATVAAVVGIVVLVPTAVLFFPALGLPVAAVPAFVLVLLTPVLLPLLDPLLGGHASWQGPVALVAAVALGAAGLAADRFTAADPVPAQLMYSLDADTGQARWVTEEDQPGAWTAGYVDRRQLVPELLGMSGFFWAGPAPAAALPAARVDVVSDVATGAGRTVTVRIVPQRPVRLLALEAGDGPTVRAATVAGAPVDVRDGRLDLIFHAPPPEGLELRLELTAQGRLDLSVLDGSDGLSGLPGFVPRPPDVGIAGSHTSELVAVTRTQRI
ncbi:M20/M25/M40 family metallo-hydrolase [Pseudonocardia sp. N23]|uniref:M20/M25/M40 family metallo-hydrolase n=1 Tax=Pseudonocardia sp. N23 TaxID=1987376 RepID=UPI000C036222|nr:M20/M25/M40 family metallo-hydrolase [Pseudonocardia sp. N23]GAY07452.1 peptidase, M20/M25/M40 family [Pseudonocardia sp. N23]